MPTSEPLLMGRMWPTPNARDHFPAHTADHVAMKQSQGHGMSNLTDAAAGTDTSAPTSSPQLTLFAEAFPASRTRSLADVPAADDRGHRRRTSPESFASVDPDGSWLKTCQGFSQVTLDGSLARFSETWPRAGMTRSGIAYRRVPSAPLTDATESGLWLTPTVEDYKSDGPKTMQEWHDAAREHRPVRQSAQRLRNQAQHRLTRARSTTAGGIAASRIRCTRRSRCGRDADEPRSQGRERGRTRQGAGEWPAGSCDPISWVDPASARCGDGERERVGRYGTTHGARNPNDEVALWPTPTAMTDKRRRGDVQMGRIWGNGRNSAL